MGEPLEPPHESVVLVEYPGKTRFAAQRFGQKWLMFGKQQWMSWAALNAAGNVTVLVEDRAPSLVAELAATIANLAEHIEQRAQEIAAPEIARAESVAVGRIAEVEYAMDVAQRRCDQHLAAIQRVKDLRYRWSASGLSPEMVDQLGDALAGRS